MLLIKFVDFFNFALITHNSPLFRASDSFLRRFVPVDSYKCSSKLCRLCENLIKKG